MFILRKTSKNPHAPLQWNLCMGTSYNLVYKEGGSEDFEQLSRDYVTNGISEGLYGFVIYNNGSEIFPLFEAFNYYVMASDGKTFSNITHK